MRCVDSHQCKSIPRSHAGDRPLQMFTPVAKVPLHCVTPANLIFKDYDRDTTSDPSVDAPSCVAWIDTNARVSRDRMRETDPFKCSRQSPLHCVTPANSILKDFDRDTTSDLSVDAPSCGEWIDTNARVSRDRMPQTDPFKCSRQSPLHCVTPANSIFKNFDRDTTSDLSVNAPSCGAWIATNARVSRDRMPETDPFKCSRQLPRSLCTVLHQPTRSSKILIGIRHVTRQ